MAITLYKIAEKARIVLEKRVSVQVLVSDVASAYATVARQRWFENTQFDEQEVDGAFVTTFKNLEPILDLSTDQYYIIIPSTYLNLPHQSGIAWVSNMLDRTSFVKVNNWGLFSGIKAGLMGGRQVYSVEGNRMYFPKMRKEDSECKIILKLAIALDNVDPYEELNIPSDIEDAIVKEVVSVYVQKQNPIEKVREIIN
jgi:hypothetical protein